MKARVIVTLKEAVLDPQGKAIESAVKKMGFSEMTDMRVGKVFDLRVDEKDPEKAKERLRQIGQKLLSNPVIENVEIEVRD